MLVSQSHHARCHHPSVTSDAQQTSPCVPLLLIALLLRNAHGKCGLDVGKGPFIGIHKCLVSLLLSIPVGSGVDRKVVSKRVVLADVPPERKPE